MRLLFVHREVGHFFGGVENHIRELAKRLALRGQVIILTERGKTDPLLELKLIRNIKVVYLPHLEVLRSIKIKRAKTYVSASIKKSYYLTKYLRLIDDVPWLLKVILWILLHRKECDVVSVHTFIDTVAMQFINKIVRLPYVSFLEGYDFIEAENAKHANIVVAISKFIYDQCRKVHGFEPYLIPIGVDIKKFQKVNKEKVNEVRKKYCPQNELLVLNVARLSASKDIPTMIKAAAIVNKRYNGVKFVVCGEGEDRTILEDMIEKYNLKDKFFLVPVFGEDLPPFYKAADVFLHVPKFGIHFQIVYLEAMASGCPIIGADAEAGPDILGNAAILVKPGREDVLANALLRLIKDKKLRRGLANKAKERAKIFDWKKLIPLYESVYKEALSLSIDSKMRR